MTVATSCDLWSDHTGMTNPRFKVTEERAAVEEDVTDNKTWRVRGLDVGTEVEITGKPLINNAVIFVRWQ